MRNLTVKDILNQTGGILITGNEKTECICFSKDTRTINDGDCYIGIKGERFDGSKFWCDALDKGASTVIIENVEVTEEEKNKYLGKNIIKVENTLEALYKIAGYKRDLYNIPVIAITGSVGKTSTKDIIANVVSKKYKTLKTIGNNNNNIGMPFTILRLQDEEAIVLEMGMNHLGEISLLSKIAKPTICVITNVGTSHIGNLGSRENILKAKLEIFEGNKDATIIINNDNDLLHKWYEENKENKKIKTYGIKEKSDIQAEEIELYTENSKFTYYTDNEKLHINVPIGGEHFILNSLCALTVGKELEISENQIIEGIETLELTKNRMDIVNLKNNIKVINSAYNASPEAMEASLKSLSEYKERKIAVLVDMLELGKYSAKLHEKIGKSVFENNIDILICSGKYSNNIVDGAKKAGMSKINIYNLKGKDEIINVLNNIINENDVVLFKASNSMKFYEIVEKFIELHKN